MTHSLYLALVATLLLLVSGFARADAGAPLTLDEFLKEVRTGNTGVLGDREASQAEMDRSEEGKMLITPTAFANASYSHDGKPQVVPISSYSFQQIWQYNLGLSQTTTFGLTARLSTNLYALSYSNATSFFTIFAADPYDPFLQQLASGVAFPGTINVTNQLELSQSLWSNGFGAATRADQSRLEAQALTEAYGNRYTARTRLVQAEADYWKLLIARQSIALTRDNLERAQKTYDWNLRRAKLQLADQSDALQSQAQLESRKLEYQSAIDGEKTAARAFNTDRGQAGDVVNEILPDIGPDAILAMAPPRRAEYRDDVKAAEQNSRAAMANAQIAREREKPTLDVFGSLALNGQDFANLGPAYGQALSLDHPTATIGVRFSAPLAIGDAAAYRAAYTREEAASDSVFQRKVFEQEQGWKDLVDRLDQSKRQLQLAVSVEKAQQAKLFHERERYRTGRTTAFQVLSFETDYAQSELVRLNSEGSVLGLLTQMKLYGEEL